MMWIFDANQALGQEVEGSIYQIGDATHIEFSGRSSWTYELRKDESTQKNILVLTVPKLSEATVKKMTRWDRRAQIEKIEISSVEGRVEHQVKFHLKDHVDSFDYLTDQPSRMVIDFFESTSSVPETKTKKKVAESSIDQLSIDPVKIVKLPKKRPMVKREPAASETINVAEVEVQEQSDTSKKDEQDLKFGVFDAADKDFLRFDIKDYEINERSILSSQRNIYIHFPMLRPEWKELEAFLRIWPEYEIKEKDDEENKMARLLLTLYKNERNASYLKTLEFFNKKFSDTKYKEIIDYMTADIYYRLWKEQGRPSDFQSAITRYDSLSSKFPNSPLAERTLLFIAYSYYQRGDHLRAIKSFRRFLRIYSGSQKKTEVLLAIADGYLRLNKHEDAKQMLEEVERTSTDVESKAEANFRLGDLYFNQRKYKEAIEAYNHSIRSYRAQKNQFPSAQFNLAESQFWIGDYRSSLDAHRSFLQEFPGHRFGGYSMTRIGELFDIFGANPSKSKAAFLESDFRFAGDTSLISRIRLLSLKIKDARPKELEKDVEEIRRLARDSNVPRVNDFATVLIADGFKERKEFTRALDELVNFYQNNPTSINLNVIQARIVQNITEMLKHGVENNDFISVFKWHDKYRNNWLKDQDRIDLTYLLGQAYEQAGVLQKAADIYRQTLNRLYALRGTKVEKERSVFEVLPHPDALNLRLASTSFGLGQASKALQYLNQIESLSNLTESEKVDRSIILSEISMKSNRVEMAVKELQTLVDTWRGQPELVSKPHLRLSQIYFQTKEWEKCKTHLQFIENLIQDTKQVPEGIEASALELRGDLELKLKNQADSIKYYGKLLEKYEEKINLFRIRYKVGKILFDSGDTQKAEKTWDVLRSKEGAQTWISLADDHLKERSWTKEYRQYLDRIPAAQKE